MPPPAKAGPPTWLVGAGFAVLLIAVFGGIYYMMSGSSSSSPAAAVADAPKPAAAAAAADANPLQKRIEVTGIRFLTVNKAQSVRFIVVNHTAAEVADLAGNVDLKAGSSRADATSAGSFAFRIDSIGPNETKELTVPLKTSLKPYELPDWQATFPDVEITSPKP